MSKSVDFRVITLSVTILISHCTLTLSETDDSKGVGTGIPSSTSLNINAAPSSNWSRTLGDLSIFETLILNRFHEKVVSNLLLNGTLSSPSFFSSKSNLMNWLAAYRWNLAQTEKAYIRSYAWREMNKVDILGKKSVDQEMLHAFYYEIKGRDKQGCPILAVPIGEWRTPRSFLAKTKSTSDTFTKIRVHFIQMIESVMNLMHRHPSSCAQFVLLSDLDGFTHHHSSGSTSFRWFLDTLQKNYPHSLKQAYFINCPPSFVKMVTLINSSISEDLRSRLSIFTDKSHWTPVLLQNIPQSHLHIGGHHHSP